MVEKSGKRAGVWLALALAVVLGACSGSSDSVLPAEPSANNDSQDNESVASTDEQADSSDVEQLATAVAPDDDGLAIEITSVTDGDSVRATSEAGDLEIRLIGLNAPEQDECFGSEAQVQLEQLLQAGDVTLHPWPAELDDFGRELGFLVADGVFVNLSLIETGHVLARAQSNHDFIDTFNDAEDRARAASFGIWSDDACGEAVEGDLVITDVFENAPGDDRENPNGEFVIIENVGDSAVQMQGWGLRDESTRHRYTFPSVEVGPGESMQIRTGCGDDDQGSNPIALFWCDPEPPVWNNDGDLALLLDPNGGIVSEFSYGG